MSPFVANLLAGKTVLVTGGGTGLGRAIARGVAMAGARVVICGRRQTVLDDTAAALREEVGADIRTIACDIRDAAAVAAMMDVLALDGGIDVLVNNAAGAILGQAETLSAGAFDAVLKVGLNGTIYCTIEAGRRWIEQDRRGVVLSVVASGVERGRPFTSPLTVAKGGVLTLMRGLAVEWGPKGIRCLAVSPGMIPTEAAMARIHAAGPANLKSVPLGRPGRGEELADLCVFLMSDHAAYITGEMITIDGGKALKGQDMDAYFDWGDEDWARLRQPRPPRP